jgi:hypothetical protein
MENLSNAAWICGRNWALFFMFQLATTKTSHTALRSYRASNPLEEESMLAAISKIKATARYKASQADWVLPPTKSLNWGPHVLRFYSINSYHLQINMTPASLPHFSTTSETLKNIRELKYTTTCPLNNNMIYNFSVERSLLMTPKLMF